MQPHSRKKRENKVFAIIPGMNSEVFPLILIKAATEQPSRKVQTPRMAAIHYTNPQLVHHTPAGHSPVENPPAHLWIPTSPATVNTSATT